MPGLRFSSTFLLVKALKCEVVGAVSAVLPGRQGRVPVPLRRHSVPNASRWWLSAALLATASPSKYLPVESRAGWDFHSSWKVLTSQWERIFFFFFGGYFQSRIFHLVLEFLAFYFYFNFRQKPSAANVLSRGWFSLMRFSSCSPQCRAGSFVCWQGWQS